ncbi:MAG TPA: Fe-S cluster assembly transcriptional regulator IscR [Marinobacter sp.]|jgi:Rrf2 family iron-sulfur cluster assembly transcriptional regulator|uniref:Fe-S cluster assembly transcriptional regulator IscR n=1 Tax=Marinobacter sp. TaxID=50741 RepID=UPI000EED7801|nr:Fe-S cluster assembly transcriptional regulator IscR [Marinobacter sp.]MBC7193198.1 Fe-S cluster assembly transcriptional regulator IscR [Marinobacter sp.]HCW90161.1 Fe-S cluster assembly transcriptional regulator IscR [Marinobacter sp.]
MKLTTKGRYAVTAMLDLALHTDVGPVSLAEISSRQEISLSYLEQLFARLRRRNLVVSVRGPGGGYRLGRGAEAVFVSDVVDAVNESLDTTRCKNRGDCQNGEMCLTHHLWSDLSDQIHQFLSQISLADLMKKREIQVVAARQNLRQAKGGGNDKQTINTGLLGDQTPA